MVKEVIKVLNVKTIFFSTKNELNFYFRLCAGQSYAKVICYRRNFVIDETFSIDVFRNEILATCQPGKIP